MPQTKPQSFVPDKPVNKPASFVPDSTPERKSGGASGSWEEPSTYQKTDKSIQDFQTNHPYLSFPLTAIPRAGKAFVDTAVGTAKGIYHAAVDPTTEEEKKYPALYGESGLPIKRFVSRMTVGPQLEEKRKADEAAEQGRGLEAFGHSVAAGLPIIGPLASHLTETAVDKGLPESAGELGFMVLTGELLKQVPGLNESPLPKNPSLRSAQLEKAINERQLSAVVERIKSGVKDQSAYDVARVSIPVWQQAAGELGTTLEQSLADRFPIRAVGEKGKQSVRSAGEHAVDIAEHAIDITERPFTEVLDRFGDVSTARVGDLPSAQVQMKIIDRLSSIVRENAGVNPPLASAIEELINRVRSNGGTYRGLNDLKVLANKKSSALFDKSIGQQINASADASYAWKELGDVIRGEMYPELQRLSGTDLQRAGAKEAAVMDARDGLRRNYYSEVLPAHAERMAQTYWEYVRQGSLHRRNMLSRALGLARTPAGEFNAMFSRGLGDAAPMPDKVPVYFRRTPEKVPTVTGEQSDLFPHDFDINSHPLLSAPPGTAFTREGPGGSTMGEDIFRVQQRADRTARSAPPPTVTGTQTNLPGANEAKPGEPFYPGRMGVQKRIGPNGEEIVEDFTNQNQLFSHYQTPYKWKPSLTVASSTQQLQSMAAEIEHYLKTQSPPPVIRRQWEADLKSVQDEVFRRKEALRTPSARKGDANGTTP